MTQNIYRMYGSAELARTAAAELSEFRQLNGAVHVVEAPSPTSTIDEIAQAVMKFLTPRKEAKILAEGISRGGTLVVVHTPLFAATTVEEYLDQYQPIDSGLRAPEPERFTWDEAAPFSSAFRLPTWLSDPTPFSTFWNLPVLKEDRSAQSEGMETISFFSRKSAMFSGLFGLAMLSDKATPFSNFFGLPLLSSKSAPFSAVLKLPTLLRPKNDA